MTGIVDRVAAVLRKAFPSIPMFTDGGYVYPELSPIDLADPYADCQHVVGGWWGNHLRFMDGLPTLTGDLDEMTGYSIWGHQPAETRVKIGDLITHEYGNTWVTFIVMTVDYKSDPPDMFFGTCDLIRVCAKGTGETLYLRGH